MKSAAAALSLLALLMEFWMVEAQDQEVGVTICACQPSQYEFELDLDLTCDDFDIQRGDPGILDTACVVNTSGDQDVTDFTPVVVTDIQVLELDQNFDVVGDFLTTGEYVSGDKFSYTSVTANPETLTATTVPSAIQLFLSGRNAAGQDLVNFYAIVYNNECNVYPVLSEGNNAGWTELVSMPKEKTGCQSDEAQHSLTLGTYSSFLIKMAG